MCRLLCGYLIFQSDSELICKNWVWDVWKKKPFFVYYFRQIKCIDVKLLMHQITVNVNDVVILNKPTMMDIKTIKKRSKGIFLFLISIIGSILSLLFFWVWFCLHFFFIFVSILYFQSNESKKLYAIYLKFNGQCMVITD